MSADRKVLRFTGGLSFVGALLLLIVMVPQPPATISICASGCTYPNGASGANLQTALNAAAPGAEVLLQEGFTYSAPDDGWWLGAQCMAVPVWDCITVRTGVTSTGTLTPLSSFPAAGVRMSTGYRATLAKILPTVNNSPSLRTIYPGQTGATCASAPCRGDGWTVKWIEFGPKADYAQRHLVRFGTFQPGREWNGSCGTWPDPTPSCWNTTLPGADTQDRWIEVPRYLSFIQNDVHGDPFMGQSGGLLLSSRDTRVYHNSFTDIKSLVETQALTSLNGIGPFDVQNNLFEATGENFMFGGGDPYLIGRATVGASPTSSAVTLTNPVWYSRIDTTTQAANLTTDIYSGIYIAIIHSGVTYNGIKCTLSGTVCTFTPTLPFTPSVGDVIQWDWVHGGITLQYNYSRKPLAWMGDAIPVISSGVTATAHAGGLLTSGSKCYRVLWWANVSGGEAASVSSAQQCVSINGTTEKSVTISWPAQTNATRYWVYGRTSGAQTLAWETAAGVTSYIDDGTGGMAQTPYPQGTPWTVKNLGEWKNCDGASPAGPCLAQGNVFERSWCCTQNMGVSWKINNQEGTDFSSALRNFTFRDNWVRHANRGLAISCSNADSWGGGLMSDVTVTNNLFTDLNSVWKWPTAANGGDPSNYSAIIVTSGQDINAVPPLGCTNLTMTHNSFFVNTNDMNGPLQIVNPTLNDPEVNFVLRNNIMGRDCTACGSTTSLKFLYSGGGSEAQGTVSWNVATTSSSADHNAWPDGNSTIYTAGPFTTPFFPTDAVLKSLHLVNYTACDADTDILGCGLAASSSMHNQASDGMDIGANVGTIQTWTNVALSGNIPTPPTSTGRGRMRVRLRGCCH